MLAREKLIKYGANALAEYELLAIILGVGSSGENVFDLSMKLIKKYSNLSDLLSLTYEELIKVKGIKKAKATKILASIEFAKRIFEYKDEKVKFDDPKTIYSFMRYEVENLAHEEFFVLYLDKRLRLIKKMMLARGSVSKVGINNKDIFKNAFKLDSSYIVLIHNHPSGLCCPSEADDIVTNCVLEVSKQMGIYLIDHMIISGDGYYSYLENHKIEL